MEKLKIIKNKLKSFWQNLKDKVVRFKKWLVILIFGAAVVAAPSVIPPNVPDIALEKIQAKYEASDIKDKYRLEKTAFILDAIDENAIQAEVGNKNSDSFEPSLTLRKWNDEVNFKVKYKHAEKEKDQKVDIENKKIKWKGKKTEVHYYDLKKGEMLIGEELEHDVFEVEVILLEKPDTNIVEFDIETKGLNFYYQPALNSEDNPEADSCTETQCFKDGEVITHRPENVIGSYAVYHESKAGDYSKMGLKNYRAGKAFHIYRPKIIDNAGKEVWGKLNITDNLLTVEIPQEFLDNAVYPVRHAAGLTFGYLVNGGSSDSVVLRHSSIGYRCYRVGSTYVSGGAGTVDKISAYLSTNVTGTYTVAFLLNDEDSGGSGSHGQIVLAEGSLSLGASYALKEINAASESIVNDSYIINVTADGTGLSSDFDGIRIASDFTGANRNTYYEEFDNANASTAFANSKENPWTESASSSTNLQYSIYCTYTAGGADARRMFLTQ
jgi:hypothetical protein